MWSRFVSFIMGIVLVFCETFGIGIGGGIVGETLNRYIYRDVSYGEHERNTLNLYIPKNTDGDVGLILMIHGGAWVAGSKSGYNEIIKDWSKKGYATAAINYRYMSYDVSFEDILDDIEAAVAFIKRKGEENGVNINRMLLSGHSAGGHLSMLYAYSRKDSSAIEPVAVVNESGPTDLLDPNFYNETASDVLRALYVQIISYLNGSDIPLEDAYKVHDLLEKGSPLYYVDENTVPTVINHGMKDDIVPFSNALSLEKAFKEHGAAHIMNIYPNSGHGLSEDEDSREKGKKYFEEYVQTYLD